MLQIAFANRPIEQESLAARAHRASAEIANVEPVAVLRMRQIHPTDGGTSDTVRCAADFRAALRGRIEVMARRTGVDVLLAVHAQHVLVARHRTGNEYEGLLQRVGAQAGATLECVGRLLGDAGQQHDGQR